MLGIKITKLHKAESTNQMETDNIKQENSKFTNTNNNDDKMISISSRTYSANKSKLNSTSHAKIYETKSVSVKAKQCKRKELTTSASTSSKSQIVFKKQFSDKSKTTTAMNNTRLDTDIKSKDDPKENSAMSQPNSKAPNDAPTLSINLIDERKFSILDIQACENAGLKLNLADVQGEAVQLSNKICKSFI